VSPRVFVEVSGLAQVRQVLSLSCGRFWQVGAPTVMTGFFPNGSAAVMTASCPLPAVFWFAPGTVLFAVGLQLLCGLCGFWYRM
jgi:hypothetical protein